MLDDLHKKLNKGLEKLEAYVGRAECNHSVIVKNNVKIPFESRNENAL